MDRINENMTPNIHPLAATESKIDVLIDKLKNEYLWLSDEFRSEEKICAILTHYFEAADCVVYEYGDFKAVFIIHGIIPGWKASLSFKLVDPKVWSPAFVRECREFLVKVMAKFGLFRLATSTPDARVVKMARMVGFDSEGTHFRGFRWDGTYYDDTLMCLMED